MRFCFEIKDFIEREIDPDRSAVIDTLRDISWKQFELEVNNICRLFVENHWDKMNGPVILYGHKQADMIIAIYSMMKLQIAYIPIDVIYPVQRINTIRHLASVELIINCTDQTLDLDKTTELMLCCGKPLIAKQHKFSISDKIINVDPLVYIIFTSGSTGEPKGVQITSKAVCSFVKWMVNDFGFTSKDVFVNIAVFSFDLSVYELMTFGALGATLLLNDKSITENTEFMMNRVNQYKGTVWVSTPSYSLAYSRIDADARLNSLKYFLFCGETLPHSTANKLHISFPQAIIYNTYGPTEATVATTKIEITHEILDAWNPLPVGYPKPDCEILIDKENEQDKEGELIIVGDNVSIGYFNNEELNRLKFFKHEGRQAFRTGDYAYYTDGMLFCKGRNDDQVKMHGFRIELSEISNVLCSHDFILEAVTVPLKRNNEVKKIVSFVIPKKSVPPDELTRQLLPFLKERLPYYMIPGDIDIVKDFFYSTNHKIDKIKLIEDYLKRKFLE
jgi:D-alanine--poly(phosphoribitol) ligase subunit 1